MKNKLRTKSYKKELRKKNYEKQKLETERRQLERNERKNVNSQEIKQTEECLWCNEKKYII